jgi:hypothetical protein
LEREPVRRTLKLSCGDNRVRPVGRGRLRSMKTAVRAMDERDVSAV